MRFGKLQFCRKLVSLFKITVALTWEACDNVSADSHARHKSFGCRNDRTVTLTVIATCHTSQYMIRTALHWQMEMTTHSRILPQFQPLQAKIFRLKRRNTYAMYFSLV